MDVAKSGKFVGAKSIISTREEYVEGDTVKKDVIFKSSSTTANFVTGRRTNGMITCKDKNEAKLKDLL